MADKKHMDNLSTLCRVCGQSTLKVTNGRLCGARRLKHPFKVELQDFYKIDIHNDIDGVHPTLLCQSHTHKLYRFRQAKSNGKNCVPMDVAHVFEPHNSVQCTVCSMQEVCVSPSADIHSSNSTDRQTRKRPSSIDNDNNALQIMLQMSSNDRVECLEKLFASVSKDERAKLAYGLGNACALDLMADVRAQEFSTKDIVTLDQFQPCRYMQTLSLVLRSFVNGICQVDKLSIESECDDKSDKKLAYQIAIICENIYKMIKPNFIGIASFMQNLNLFSITNSKLATNINGSTMPGGKYTTISNWLSQQASCPPTCPQGDIVVMYDNEQIIGKTWSIKPNNKVKVSIITNIAALPLTDKTCLQKRSDLHPRKWLPVANNHHIASHLPGVASPEVEDTDESKGAQSSDLSDSGQQQIPNSQGTSSSEGEATGITQGCSAVLNFKSLHYEQLYGLVDLALCEVLNSQKLEQSCQYSDDVDIAVEQRRKIRIFRLCPNDDCGEDVPRTKRKCPKCGSSMKNSENVAVPQRPVTKVTVVDVSKVSHRPIKMDLSTNDRYENIPSSHTGKAYNIQILDPVFVNPNSPSNIAKVLRHIGQSTGVTRYPGGTDRSWTMVCCDGLPFTMMKTLCEEFLVCQLCHGEFVGTSDFLKHAAEAHDTLTVTEVPYIREFDWVLPVVGDGHYEMNLMKSFVELNWDVFMNDLVKRMGWRSEAAQQSARKCYDNHKTWQLIMVFHLATLQELVLPYVRECIEGQVEPSPEDFFGHFCPKKCESSHTFAYYLEMVCRYSQGILNFRMAVRRNNAKLLQAARFMTKELFHGRNHPKYQEIEIYKSYMDQVAPHEVSKLLEENSSVSKSGSLSSGQGYDFILEEENREVLRWIRRGVATDELWQQVIRNKDKLQCIRSKLLDILGLQDKDLSMKPIDLTEAIDEWRISLRDSEMFSDDNSLLLSMSPGIELNQSLLNFTEDANRKRKYRVLSYLLRQPIPDDPTLRYPVFVTTEENLRYNSLQNQTISTIDKHIAQLIEQILDEDLKLYHTQHFNKKVIRKKKDIHIEHYMELMSLIADQAQPVEVHVPEDSVAHGKRVGTIYLYRFRVGGPMWQTKGF